MRRLVGLFLSVEAAAFGAAALLHSGVAVGGYEHARAATAESVIGLVLLAGLLASAVSPRRSRAAGLACQGFALLGTVVGVFTIIVGVGPQSALDLAIHAGFITLLAAGLLRVSRAGESPVPR